MRKPCPRSIVLLALGICTASPAFADVQTWRIEGGVTSIAIEERLLEGVGLRAAHVRATASLEDEALLAYSAPVHSFAAEAVGEAAFRVKDGAFAGFDGSGAAIVLGHQGGLTLAPAEGARSASRPLFLYDFTVRIDPAAGASGLSLTAGPDASPFEVRSASFLFDAHEGVLRAPMADVVVSEAFARSIGQPELAGDYLGSLDLTLSATLVRTETVLPEDKPPPAGGTFTDVKLGQLYGLDDVGREGGIYPTGVLGLSCATTSCNVGTEDVPWREPMNENHPTIGMAMFRIMNDRLEMIGHSWSKHGFFALSSSQCTQCQHFSNGTFLGVGCSDTYSVGNNASQYYLSGRSEVNPHTAVWEFTGSWFDGTPVDCVRSNSGNGLDDVAHRIVVQEADLPLTGATYFYEGCYYVRNDVNIENNIGWRAVTVTHPSGNNWVFATQGGGLAPNEGPYVLEWGDMQDVVSADVDDGLLMLSTKVTDLGEGQWHYEYAFYNRSSDRMVREFSVPVGGANVTNVGFHDVDANAANDWTASVSGGSVTWATGDFGDPNANPVGYQLLYNFRFDADMPPNAAQATASLYKPGAAPEALLDTQSPFTPPTGIAVAGAAVDELALRADPNPFAASTRVSFAMPAKGAARLVVTDVAGRTIRTLFEGTAEAGRRDVNWDGRDDAGRTVSSGVYFFRIESEGRVRTIKGTLLK